MTPGLRKLALVAHVTTSVGWLGAVASFLALAGAGLVEEDAETVRAAYIAMDLVGWWVVVPASLASLTTGLVVALGTPWGLFRHWWVLAKFLMNLVATALLLLHMQPVGTLAAAAAASAIDAAGLHGIRVQIVLDAAAALVLLFAAVALSVLKPQGLTRYGWRKQHEARAPG